MTILANYKDNLVGNYKDNTERATTIANKSMGFDPKATQSCFKAFLGKSDQIIPKGDTKCFHKIAGSKNMPYSTYVIFEHTLGCLCKIITTWQGYRCSNYRDIFR